MYRQTEAIADDQRMPINYRKSKVFSTISTRLLTGYWRPEPESNRRIRICSPLRHHSAIGPQAQNCVERAPLAFPFRNGNPFVSQFRSSGTPFQACNRCLRVLPLAHIFERHLVGSVANDGRSEEQTSELQSLMRISYAVF